MTCKEIRELLSPYADARLPGAVSRDVAAHLEACESCRDEFEALRLSDQAGKSQEEAARAMRVSRATFGRIVESAHRKVAEALVGGKALEIRQCPWTRFVGQAQSRKTKQRRRRK